MPRNLDKGNGQFSRIEKHPTSKTPSGGGTNSLMETMIYEGRKEIETDDGRTVYIFLKNNGIEADVFLDQLPCGTVSMMSNNHYIHGLDEIGRKAIVIGDEIYFRNHHNYQKIKGGKVDTLENVRNVFEYDGQVVTIKWDEDKKLLYITKGDERFPEGYNMIKDTYGHDITLYPDMVNFKTESGEFGFIGKKLNGKDVLVTGKSV